MQQSPQRHSGHEILRTLVGGDAHGHTIAKVIERTSEDVLEVEQGSLYPALHRLEDRCWVSSYWGASENNRKAKFYRPTATGRKQLVRETSRPTSLLGPLYQRRVFRLSSQGASPEQLAPEYGNQVEGGGNGQDPESDPCRSDSS